MNIDNFYAFDINWIDEKINYLNEEIKVSESQSDKIRAAIETFEVSLF